MWRALVRGICRLKSEQEKQPMAVMYRKRLLSPLWQIVCNSGAELCGVGHSPALVLAGWWPGHTVAVFTEISTKSQTRFRPRARSLGLSLPLAGGSAYRCRFEPHDIVK